MHFEQRSSTSVVHALNRQPAKNVEDYHIAAQVRQLHEHIDSLTWSVCEQKVRGSEMPEIKHNFTPFVTALWSCDSISGAVSLCILKTVFLHTHSCFLPPIYNILQSLNVDNNLHCLLSLLQSHTLFFSVSTADTSNIGGPLPVLPSPRHQGNTAVPPNIVRLLMYLWLSVSDRFLCYRMCFLGFK